MLKNVKNLKLKIEEFLLSFLKKQDLRIDLPTVDKTFIQCKSAGLKECLKVKVIFT